MIFFSLGFYSQFGQKSIIFASCCTLKHMEMICLQTTEQIQEKKNDPLLSEVGSFILGTTFPWLRARDLYMSNTVTKCDQNFILFYQEQQMFW